jgi:hypothetical protein
LREFSTSKDPEFWEAGKKMLETEITLLLSVKSERDDKDENGISARKITLDSKTNVSNGHFIVCSK